MSVLSSPEQVPPLAPTGVDPAGLTHTKQGADWLARFLWNRLSKIREGRLTVVDGGRTLHFGNNDSNSLSATLTVRNPRFYRRVILGGSIGAAEAYIQRDWDTNDLLAVLQIFAINAQAMAGIEQDLAQLARPLRRVRHWLKRNTRQGSRRNISAHYDLSNDFFKLMLDPSMTYSSGYFPTPSATLEQASTEKYDRICRKLALQPNDRVIEIGTGWGGFAEHAARHYGCHVTTTTISQEQHRYAQQRIQAAGLAERVTLLQQDYRDLNGQYDKLVSIEMIEAVGEAFLPGYFAKCSALLKPTGMMALQAITIPDHRFDRYRHGTDFIQHFIFPGGFLPSVGAISRCVGSETDFRFFHSEDFGPHYATTLAHWRRNFWSQMPAIEKLGFDDPFVRTWDFYLCYCEAGFRERQVGVSQFLLTKPDCRREPLSGTMA